MEYGIHFLNPITNEDDVIKLNFDKISYGEWQRLNSKNKTEFDIINHLLRWHSAKVRGFSFETDYTSYCYEKNFILPVLYNLIRINNPFLFNEIVEKIIDVHKENIVIYNENKTTVEVVKPKKRKLQNKFYKQEQLDIFGNVKYIYINPITEEEIESNDPNLLEKLNKPKRKRIKTTVPISSMTFSFKKK